MEKNLPEIKVMYVPAKGVKNSVAAFTKLEGKLPTLKGRHFYGTLIGRPETGDYKACVEIIPSDNPSLMGLSTWTIPGGKYEQRKIIDWHHNLDKIGAAVKEIMTNHKFDSNRPVIEHYRSNTELRILVPVL